MSADKVELKECRLFLLRYVPDLVRDEFLNIGLFLYSQADNYLNCLLTDDFRRIKRFHPPADLDFLRELQEHFEQQIDEHEKDLEGLLREMQESYSNMLQLSEPRPCLLRDPQAEIERLFDRYVGPRVSGPLPLDTRLRLKHRMTDAFRRGGLLAHPRFEKRISASQWTEPGDPFTFDYGYQPNGHMKLIHALTLEHGPKVNVDAVKGLAFTLERVCKRESAELTAVVDNYAAAQDEKALYCQRLLEEHRVLIQPIAGIETFAQSVRRELQM